MLFKINLTYKHYLILVVWFVINVLQSIGTGLHYDESYYWMYSQNLDWGFFDHPPMSAFLIHIGYLICQAEIGVRLFFILISTLTIALIINEINEKDDLLFLSLFVFSFPLVHTHIGGFLALPDVPLVFFSILFFIIYRKFIEKPDLKLTVFISVILAAMIYSKYHSALIIIFTVLSNLKLFRNKYFWLTILFTLILLSPHIYWQIQNDFPTFRYHLFERAKPFRLKYVLPYLTGQLALAGPLTGVIVFWKLRKFKISNQFKKTLIYNILGFYIVFFLLSFYNRIEGHWTAAVIPILMLVTYPIIYNDPISKKWFKRFALPVVILFFIFRFYLAVDIIPNIGNLKWGFYHREELAQEVHKLANGKKVGFLNNYAAAANYTYYTGEHAVLISEPGYRFCQYDFWNEEATADGQPMLIIVPEKYNPPNIKKFSDGKEYGYFTIEEFQSLKGMLVEVNDTNITKDSVKISVELVNNTNKIVKLKHPSQPAICWRQHKTELGNILLNEVVNKDEIKPGEINRFELNIQISQLDQNIPLIIYTRTFENNRGEMTALKLTL